MGLERDEVAVGVVANFDVDFLNDCQAIQKPASPTPPGRPRPFVCVQVQGDRSVWAPLTTQEKGATSDGDGHRLPIKPEWREYGTEAWQRGDTYLNDGSTTYLGHSDAFVEASSAADTYHRKTRRWISKDGVSAILERIRARGGQLL